ncbi:MAG: GAF domain-containing protein [Deltaproteobacteria bacterium]|jgi:HAMP domain-containing protein|nr:GAF domain-containing protein [Deltaproteobacteria bacterium]
MQQTKPQRQKHSQKSKLAARARDIHTLLLTLALALMAGAAALTVMDINGDAAGNLARSYAVEAAERFHAHVGQNLVLVRKASRSKAVAGWLADEANQAKRLAALDEMMDDIGLMPNANVYVGVNASQNEYSIEQGATPADFAPIGRLNSSNAADDWYFECVNSRNDYAVKFDTDKYSHKWHLWISHKVLAGKKLVGVFSAGVEAGTLVHTMFGKYDGKNVKGYVVDRYGVIQMDGAFSEFYAPESAKRIHEESADSAFASTIEGYLSRIDGLFPAGGRPELVKLAGGAYGYASIAPIAASDWSVVVFFNNYALYGLSHFLAALFVLPAVFVLYVAARNILMRRLIFAPLGSLTQSVSEAESGAAKIVGDDRDDEIGELARAIRKMWERLNAFNSELLHATHERRRQAQLLHTVNGAATVLLESADEKAFEASLLKGMELLGRCLDVDRVCIWRNETIDGVLHYVLQHVWRNDANEQARLLTVGMKAAYSDSPGWEDKFLRGECIHGPLISLSREEQALLRPGGARSVLIIPMYLQDKFWGYVGFDDCRRDRAFAEDEVGIVRSASLMMVSAIHRNMQAAVRLLRLNDKQECLDSFFGPSSGFSPEYQPDGELSAEKAAMYIKKTLEEGKCVFAWTHELPDGGQIPLEVTLVRVKLGEEQIIAGHVRDLREQA